MGAVSSSRNSWWSQAVQNRLVALVLVMIVVVPFIAVPADPHIGGIAALVLQTFALILGVTLVWRSQWSFSREHVTTFLRTGPNTPVLLLTVFLIFSYTLATNKLYAAQELMRWASGILLFFVVAYQFRQSKHLFLLVDTILFLGIVTSVLSLGQYVLDPSARGTILFGNQQLLGSFLMILLPIAAVTALVAQVSSEQTSLRQLVAQAATVLMVGSMLLAQTRSAWLGAAVGMAILGFLILATSIKTGSLRLKKHHLVLPVVLAIVMLGFVLLLGVQNNSIISRASTLSNISGVESWQDRLHQWRGTIRMIKERPLLGWGLGQYPIRQREYTDIGAKVTADGMTGPRSSLAEQAHNFYLQTTAELGLIGVSIMAVVMLTFLIAGFRRVVQMDAGIRRSILMASLAGMAAFSVDAISSPSWQAGPVYIFFWLVLGAGVCCLRPR